jgi:hypothetical protein
MAAPKIAAARKVFAPSRRLETQAGEHCLRNIKISL